MSDRGSSEFDPNALRAPTVDAAGKRRWIYPDRRRGPRAKKRRELAMVLLAVYLITPFLSWHDLPILRLDVQQGIMFILGQTFRFADGSYLVFIPLILGLLLAWATSLWGRVWCGYACPQTVFLDWLIRPIEEFCEGPAHRRRRADTQALTLPGFLRKSLKHSLFFGIILIISNAFLAYFVAPATLWDWVTHSPTENPRGFAAVTFIFMALYFDLIWFREQFCSFLCPYARFQSLMISAATPTVAYDSGRGEPRGKLGKKGDCIDCGLCVRVCPTGIDIRQGLQLECIQCMRCADACDSVMDGVKRARGLVRVASLRELEGQSLDAAFRVRPLIYLGLLLSSITFLCYLLGSRPQLKVEFYRQAGTTFVRDEKGQLSNFFGVRVVNQTHEPQTLDVAAPEGVRLICSLCGQTLAPDEEKSGNVVVVFPEGRAEGKVSLLIRNRSDPIDLPLLRPVGL